MPRALAHKTLDLIDAARVIAMARQPITVRGVCYQLFAQGRIPNMGKGSTDRVSRALTIARERGLIPWAWIVDDHRRVTRYASWNDPEHYLQSVARQYNRDRWQDQPERVMVISEKGTVAGLLSPVLDRYGTPFLIAHGFSSATVLYDLAGESVSSDKPLIILYVGDHDPSGRYMSDADLPERLARYGGDATIQRVALLEHQLAELPSFPAASKAKDARHRWFVDHYGDQCYELDALDPNELREAVKAAIVEHLDLDAWLHAAEINRIETRNLREFFEDNAELFSGLPENSDAAEEGGGHG